MAIEENGILVSDLSRNQGDTITLYELACSAAHPHNTTECYDEREFRRVRWCTVHNSKGNAADIACDLVTFADHPYVPCEFTDKLIEA